MRKLKVFGIVVVLLTLLVVVGVARAAGVIYVDADATGANDGSSWTDAYTDLQDALADATSGDEVWVATGVYTPGTNCADAFMLVDGVGLYGGFDGTESSRDERDWVGNVTTLSGDIAGDNVYHVVVGASVGPTAVLDGFIVTAGQGSSSGGNDSGGGGMYNNAGSPTVSHVIFSGNSAITGGGMSNFYSDPTLINVVFYNNTASVGGGGLYNVRSDPTLINVTFSSNTAPHGGGVYNFNYNTPILTNCLLWGNSPDSIFNYNSSPTVTYSAIQGGYSGTGNIDADPLFVDAANGDLRLQVNSPCIDAGTSTAAPDDDIRGVARPWGSGDDMGAYEYAIGVDISQGDSQSAGYAQPLTFTHTITNTGSQTGTFDIAASGDWLTGYDPISVTLAAAGTTTISLYAQVPGAPADGTTSGLMITATSQISGTFYATATDTVVAQAPLFFCYLPTVLRQWDMHTQSRSPTP